VSLEGGFFPDGFSNCMLVVAIAKEGACPLKAAFFPTAFQTACLLLPLQKKHVSLEGFTSACLLLPLQKKHKGALAHPKGDEGVTSEEGA